MVCDMLQSLFRCVEIEESDLSFFTNYLGDRMKQQGIDGAVKERFPNWEELIRRVQKDGYVIDQGNRWTLTDSGKEKRNEWRKKERTRKNALIESVRNLGASDIQLIKSIRKEYESESVLSHGIGTAPSGIPEEVLSRYVERSKMLDFSDIQNSENFKQKLRDYFIQQEVIGESFPITKEFESSVGEYLNCPELATQMREKCAFPNPPVLQIYIDTKIYILRWKSINETLRKPYKWDGNFLLGVYDCTNPFHAAMAEYESLKLENIEGFPKTFQTFWKHKSRNSDKYKMWNAITPPQDGKI